MPYELRGTKIFKKDTGKLVSTSKTVGMAKRALNVRNAIEHGWTPSKKRGPKKQIQ